MRMFDVQGIEIRAPRARVFEFIRNPANLPRWARAFSSVQDGHARLETPSGTVDLRLDVLADENCGTVDWRMEFPDGSVGLAHSRVTETSCGTNQHLAYRGLAARRDFSRKIDRCPSG